MHPSSWSYSCRHCCSYPGGSDSLCARRCYFDALFIREGIRLAVLQASGSDQSQLVRIVNMSVIPIYAVCIISFVMICWYAEYRPGVDILVVCMYCAGALFETFAEPLYNVYYCRLIMLPRLRAEMAAVACRSLITFVSVVLLNAGIRGFGAAQMAYGAVYFLVMALHVSMVSINNQPLEFRKITASVSWTALKKMLQSPNGKCDELLLLATHATGSSVLKHVLTEGDKIVLSISASHFNQGIYAITSNYGSLVARILFQPIEESCRVAFSRISSSGGSGLSKKVNAFSIFLRREGNIMDAASKDTTEGSDDTSNCSKSKNIGKDLVSNSSVEAMVDLLTTVLRGLILFALVFPIFGSQYSRVAVKLFLGSKWYSDETVNTLSCFCIYILVISINGIAESFVHAVVTPKSMFAFNISLVISWALFIGSAAPLMSLYGTPGLVLANCIGMVFRGAFNLYFVQSFVHFVVNEQDKENKLKQLSIFISVFPPLPICVGCFMLSGVCYFSAHTFAHSPMRMFDLLVHLSVGMVCGLLYIALVWKYCRRNIQNLISVAKGKEYKAHMM